MPASRSSLRASFFRSFFSFLSRTLCSSGDTAPWKAGGRHQCHRKRLHPNPAAPMTRAGPRPRAPPHTCTPGVLRGGGLRPQGPQTLPVRTAGAVAALVSGARSSAGSRRCPSLSLRGEGACEAPSPPPPSKPNKSGVQGLPGLPGNGDASVTVVTQAQRPRGRPGGPNGGPATHPGVQGPRPGEHTAQQTPHQRPSLTILCAHPAPTPSGIFQNSRGALHSPSLLPQTSWEPRQPGPGCGPRPGGACGGRALGSSPGGGCCLRAQPRLRGRPEGPVSGTELGREARNPAATEPASVSHSCFARSARRGSGGRPRPWPEEPPEPPGPSGPRQTPGVGGGGGWGTGAGAGQPRG